MTVGTCSRCGLNAELSSLRARDGQTYCQPCLDAVSKQSPTPAQPMQGTGVCARCGAQSAGGAVLQLAGKHMFCQPCSQLVTRWPYPQWLKLALACLLLLLAGSLIHGRKYFHAGRVMYIGERLVDKRQYAQALPYLQETLRIAPASDKAALLTAKAALLSGDFGAAAKALEGHNGGRFEHGDRPEVMEVTALWNRASDALKKAEQASKLGAQDGKSEEAARLMHEASSAYPEMRGLALAAVYFDAGAAFERKDYDGFLAIAQKQWNDEPGPDSAGELASALACKYAVTGDLSYRQKSEETLEKARQLAHGNPEQLKSLDEFSERNRYRLETRIIITKTEYERQFRRNKTAEK